MRVPMTVRVAAGDGFGRRDAAFQVPATDVLELDGGVADLVALAEQLVELDENAGACGWWNIGDGHVAGERARLRTEAPDVKIVHVEDALDGFHAGADLRERTTARRAFEQDVEGLAHDADAGPEDERGDEQRENGVDPVLAGEKNAEAARR